MPVKCNRMITTIGTPASHKMMSRSIFPPPLRHRHHSTPTVAKAEPCGHGIIPMLATFQRCPPGRSEGDDQTRRRHKARENGSAPGFVSRDASAVEGITDALLGFLRGNSGALRHKLHKVSAVFIRQRPASN